MWKSAVSNRIEVSDGTTSFVIEGRCRQCGDCCILMIKNADMVNAKGICRFLDDDNRCAFRMAEKEGLPAFGREYWEQNCRDFPAYLSKRKAPYVLRALRRMGWPTERCGYTLEVIDG